MISEDLHLLEFKKPIQACFLGNDFVVSFAADENGVYKDLVVNTEGVHPLVKVIERQKTKERIYRQSNIDFFD